MTEVATKADLNALAQTMNSRFDGLISAFHQEIREVIMYVKEENAIRDEKYGRRFDEIDAKLEALMEMSAS